MASVADRGQQLQVITHGTPVEITKPLALGNGTVVVRPVTASKSRACREGHVSNDEAPAFAKATVWQANDE
jgi:hypothetical protein